MACRRALALLVSVIVFTFVVAVPALLAVPVVVRSGTVAVSFGDPPRFLLRGDGLHIDADADDIRTELRSMIDCYQPCDFGRALVLSGTVPAFIHSRTLPTVN